MSVRVNVHLQNHAYANKSRCTYVRNVRILSNTVYTFYIFLLSVQAFLEDLFIFLSFVIVHDHIVFYLFLLQKDFTKDFRKTLERLNLFTRFFVAFLYYFDNIWLMNLQRHFYICRKTVKRNKDAAIQFYHEYIFYKIFTRILKLFLRTIIDFSCFKNRYFFSQHIMMESPSLEEKA